MSKEFKALRDKWYRKLAKSGFKEIEDVNSPNEMLKRWDSTWFMGRTSARPGGKDYTETKSINSPYAKASDSGAKFRQIQEYYYLAEHFLGEYQFAKVVHKRYWDMHSKGLSNREIAIKTKHSRKLINTVIKELKGIMLKWKF